MRLKFYHFTLILSLVAILTACTESSNERLNVLLIGNSSIYYNNMPEMLEVIASKNGVNLKTKLIAYGGYSLQDHLNDGIATRVIDSLKWDFVILNEQSTLGENHIEKGVPRVKESPSFYESVEEFVTKIKANGAKTIIISLYPRKNAPLEDGKMLNYSYMKIAEELDILLSPVSYTWKDILKLNTSWKLYQNDNLHPTPLGSYITANVLYSTITNKKSKSINGDILGQLLVDEFDGLKYQDSIISLVKMEKSKSYQISEMAYENVKKLNNSGGYFPLTKPD